MLHAATYFTDNEFNNQKFIQKQNEILRNKSLTQQIDSIRTNLNSSLQNSSTDITRLIENLKNFIYLSKSVEDFETIYKVFCK